MQMLGSLSTNNRERNKMAKAKNKAYKNLDRRIAAWNQTVKQVKNPDAYRKPGSMKKRAS